MRFINNNLVTITNDEIRFGKTFEDEKEATLKQDVPATTCHHYQTNVNYCKFSRRV